MSWRGRAVVFGLAAAALVAVRYRERLLHLFRRLLLSKSQPSTLSDPPTLLGHNFPRGNDVVCAYIPPGYAEPLWPDPTALVVETPYANGYFTLSFYSLLRSFASKPAFNPAINVFVRYFAWFANASSGNGACCFNLDDSEVPWFTILSYTPLPHIVKTGPLLGLTPDLIGVEGGRMNNYDYYSRRGGLVHCSFQPNGDVILVLGRHINLDSRITLVRLSPVAYGWDVVAFTSLTVPNRILAFFDTDLVSEVGSFLYLSDIHGVVFVQSPSLDSQYNSHLQVTIEFDQHLITRRLLNQDEVKQWQSRIGRYDWPKTPNHSLVGKVIPHRNFSTLYMLSVDEDQRLWLGGSSSRPLSLKTLAFLALTQKFSDQLDHLASLPRGFESIGIPESIGREYRRQLAWATPQPPLILDLTASPPVLKSIFASFSQDHSQCLDFPYSFAS